MIYDIPSSLNPLDLYPALDRFDNHSYNEWNKAHALYNWFERCTRPLSLELDPFNPADYLDNDETYPDTANLYVRTNPTPDPDYPTLMFVTHLDTAATPDAIRPYALGDEYAYGSGVASSQTAIVGMMVACVTEYFRWVAYPGQISFAFIADGECTGSGSMRHVQRLRDAGHGDDLVTILAHPSDNFTELEIGGMGDVELELTAPLPPLVASLQTLLNERLAWYAADADSEHFTTRSTVMPTRIWCDSMIRSSHPHRTDGNLHDANGNAPHDANALEKMLRYLKGRDLQTLVNLHTPTPEDTAPDVTPMQCEAHFGSHNHAPITAHATLWLHITPTLDAEQQLLRQVRALCDEYGVAVTVKQQTRAYQTSAYAQRLCQESLLKPAQCVVNGGGAVWSYPDVTPHLVGAFGSGTRAHRGSRDEKIYLDDALYTSNVYARIIRTFLAMNGSPATV